MRIVDVRAVHPEAPGAPQDWRSWLGQILVAVDTAEGLTGYGVGGGGAAGVHVVQTVLRSVLLGEDAGDVEDLWAKMYRQTLPFGRKGLALMAISGVDLALWDLRGKAAEKPVVELLGGVAGRAVPVYRTLFASEDAEAARTHAQTFRALKVHLGGIDIRDTPERAVERVRQVRAAVGDGVELMADAFMNWDVSSTLRAAGPLSELNLAWLEEPLPPDDLEGYARLSRECPIPIAGGEHEYTAAAFGELMDRRLHAVFQPDVCWCGGLTELVKIYRLARRHGLRVCPHRGVEVWALHAISALDAQPLAESGRPWMTWVGNRPEVEDGVVRTGRAPGFGVRFDAELWQAQGLEKG